MRFLSQDAFARSTSPSIGNNIANRISGASDEFSHNNTATSPLRGGVNNNIYASSQTQGTLTKSLYSTSYLSDLLSMVFGDDIDPISVKQGNSSDNIRGVGINTISNNVPTPVDRSNRSTRDFIYDALVSAIGEENIEQMIADSKDENSQEDSWGP
jgi:hypothetical protein